MCLMKLGKINKPILLLLLLLLVIFAGITSPVFAMSSNFDSKVCSLKWKTKQKIHKKNWSLNKRTQLKCFMTDNKTKG